MRKYLFLLLIFCLALGIQAQDRTTDAQNFSPTAYLDKQMPNIWANRIFSVKWYGEGLDSHLSAGDVYSLLNIMKDNFSEIADELDWFLSKWPTAAEVYAVNPDYDGTVYDNAGVGGNYYVNQYGNLVPEPTGDYSGDLANSTTKTKIDYAYVTDDWVRAQGGDPATYQYPGANYTKVFTGRSTVAQSYTKTISVSIGGTEYVLQDTATISPIVLDLDGDGKLQASNGNWLPHNYGQSRGKIVQFDINGDGFVDLTEWVGPKDGLLLVYKGKDVNGADLFGDVDGFLNGYEKLAVRDSNGDHKLSGDELGALSVWQDKNGNANVDAGEITAVTDLGITAIDLHHKGFVGSFVQGGKSKLMWDWYPCVFEVKRKK